MLTEDQIHAFKKQLLEMKTRLETQSEDTDRPEETGELSQTGNHPGDQGTELHEQAKNVAINNQSQQRLNAVHEALQAIENGTYGRCTVCGEPIPYERLEIVPETRVCMTHAHADTNDTGESRRPVEEDAMGGALEENDKKEEVIFDRADTWETVSNHGTSETPSDNPEQEKNDSDNEANEDPPSQKR